MNWMDVDEKKNIEKKIEKSLKRYDIINFMTIRYRLTDLGNVLQPILNYKLLRAVSILRQSKKKTKKKQAKTADSKK